MAKLLLDENLSRTLCHQLQAAFPGTAHLSDIGLTSAPDFEVWARAQRDGFAILTKDGDFHQLSLARGAPPKVIWIRAGNVSTAELASLVRRNESVMLEFIGAEVASLMMIR